MVEESRLPHMTEHQSGMSQLGVSYLCEELLRVRVTRAGVIFVRSYPGKSYLDRGNEPTISLVGYELTGWELPL